MHHPLPFLSHILKGKQENQFLEDKCRRVFNQSNHVEVCDFAPLECLCINAHKYNDPTKPPLFSTSAACTSHLWAAKWAAPRPPSKKPPSRGNYSAHHLTPQGNDWVSCLLYWHAIPPGTVQLHSWGMGLPQWLAVSFGRDDGCRDVTLHPL